MLSILCVYIVGEVKLHGLFSKYESGVKQWANTLLWWSAPVKKCVGVRGLFVRIHLSGRIVQELYACSEQFYHIRLNSPSIQAFFLCVLHLDKGLYLCAKNQISDRYFNRKYYDLLMFCPKYSICARGAI